MTMYAMDSKFKLRIPSFKVQWPSSHTMLHKLLHMVSIVLASLKMQKCSMDVRSLLNLGDWLICLISKGKPMYCVYLPVGWGVVHRSR